jgi:hypothetical protein
MNDVQSLGNNERLLASESARLCEEGERLAQAADALLTLQQTIAQAGHVPDSVITAMRHCAHYLKSRLDHVSETLAYISQEQDRMRP